MTRHRRLVSVLLAVTALLSLGFVVAVASRSRPGGLEDDPLFEFDGRLDVDLGGLAAWIVFVLAMLGAVLLVLGLKETKPRRDARKRNFLGVVLGLALFVLLFRVFQPIAIDLLESAEGSEAGDATGNPLSGSGGPVAWLFSLLVAAVVAAALTRLGLSVREVAFNEVDPQAPHGVAAPHTVAASHVLPLEDDPRSRVLAAYSRFEESASLVDLARRRNETAMRHARRVGDAAELSAPSVARLMGLFSSARFGLAIVDDGEAAEAEEISRRLSVEMLG